MNHVMIDIETLSTRANAVIISIAAVKFDPKTGDVFEEFLAHLDLEQQIKDGLHVEADTISWWMNQSDEARKTAFLNQNTLKHPSEVISDLANFIPSESFVWGNPSNFDLTIVNSLRLNYSPSSYLWDRKNVMCLRTLKNLVPDHVYKTEFDGVPHDPIDDCHHQIKQVQKIWGHLEPSSKWVEAEKIKAQIKLLDDMFNSPAEVYDLDLLINPFREDLELKLKNLE